MAAEKADGAGEAASQDMTGQEPEPDLEAGRLLFAGPCEFRYAVATLDRMPPASLPEIAFAGRSNVGKSSLINALTGRKTLARTSDTPGRTQQLNFFDLAEKLLLVDLPGYGYAKVAKSKAASWNELIRLYLRGRVPLKLVCLLVDARRGEIAPTDGAIMALLDEAAVPYRVVLTKGDKLSASAGNALLAEMRTALKTHPAALPEPMLTSARGNLGIAELRADLARIAP